MSEKQKQVLDRFGKVMERMDDATLEKILIFGEGMVVMSDLMNKKQEKTSTEKTG